ncbi:MAG TPA: cytochrome P450, partial [Alphaproteobacteria bacterium]|nr:cytochrome P450 [Alphaproteobacteria bacterium]
MPFDSLPDDTRPAAPSGLRLLRAVRRDPLGTFVAMAEGRAVTEFRLAGQRIVLLNDAAAVRQVLQDNQANYRKSAFYRFLRPLLGDGIFIAEGDAWLRQRRVLQPAFSGSMNYRGMAAHIVDAADDMLARWDRHGDRPFDLVPEMMHLALDALLRALFSRRIGPEAAELQRALTATLRRAEERVWSPLPLPEAAVRLLHPEYREALAWLDDFAARLVAERRADPDAPADLLTGLIAAHGDAPGRLLRDEILSIIISGHETTALALSWAWYLLSEAPALERRMAGEVEAALGGRAPTYEDLPRLGYPLAVFQEAARLYPPVWTLSRQAVAADTLGGVALAPGDTVMVSPYVIHRNAAYWPNPEGFDPDRFDPAQAGRHRPAYLPFGGGPRVCLGNRLAMMEAPLVMARVAQRFRLDLVPGQHIDPEPMITLRPRNGVRVRLTPRSGLQPQQGRDGSHAAPPAHTNHKKE